MNKIIVIGRVANDIELKQVGEHTKGNFRIAVKDRFKKDKTDFFSVDVWGKSAEIVEKYAPKGSYLVVEGRLQQDTWETEDGQKREKVLIVADNVELGPKVDAAGESGEAAQAKKPTTKKPSPSNDEDDIF